LSYLSDSIKIDFTGNANGFRPYSCFNNDVVELLRSSAGSGKRLVLVDRMHGINGEVEAMLVRDHLNLTGGNPLVGPNHPCGDRFTKVNDVYLTDLTPKLKSIVTAGLKPNVVPSVDEEKLLKSIGADCWCYNLVPTVLVAAHAGYKVLGLLLSANAKALPADLLSSLEALDRN
jgi:purine-nucleoside phosphorylase